MTDLLRRRSPAAQVARGLGTTAGGLMVAAAFTYAFLTVAARVLGPTDFAPLSALWAMVFIVGPGLFVPLQQELGRLLAAGRAQRSGGRAVRRAGVLAAATAAVAVALVLAAGPWLVPQLLSGHAFLLGCLVASVASWAVSYVARGALTGYGDFAGFAQLIAVESFARLPLAGLLVLVGLGRLEAFGAALALAPLVSVLLVTRGGRRLRGAPGDAVSWRALGGALGWLGVGSLMGQFLANAGPLTVQLLAGPGQHRQAGVFLSALVIARLSFYLFQAAQASLLPNLAELVAQGRSADLRASVRRLVRVGAGLVVLTSVGAWALGPFAVRLLFGPDYRIGARSIAVLAAASSVYVVVAALNSVAIAVSGHRLGALAWCAGVAAYCLGTALSDDLFLRVETGYLLGTCTSALVLLLALPRLLERSAGPAQNGDFE